MGILPDRDVNSTLVFPAEAAPASFLRGIKTTRTMAIMYMPFYAVAIAVVARALLRFEPGRAQRRSTLVLLLTNLIFSLTNIVFMTLMVSLTLDWQTCSWVGGLGGLFYINANAASYFILLQRAQAVNALQGKTPRFLLSLVRLGSISVPGVALLSAFFFSGRLYFQDTQTCVQNVDPLISWVFLVLDTTLSLGFLLLFLIPLQSHVRRMRRYPAEAIQAHSAKLMALAKFNMWLSSIAIVSTLVFMLFVSTISQILSSGETSNSAGWRLQQYYGSATDLSINSVVSLAITYKIWMPQRWMATLSKSGGNQPQPADEVERGLGVGSSLAAIPTDYPATEYDSVAAFSDAGERSRFN